MSAKKSKLENLIRDYLLDEGLLNEKISDSRYDFGFMFSYPPGPKSERMNVIKPKNKNWLFIIIQIQLSEKYANSLKSLKENKGYQFFQDIRKYFLNKEVYFKIDLQKFKYDIHEQVFPDNNGNISKDIFFKRIQRVFYCFLFSNLLLGEYCSGKEISSSKFGPEFDLSLYS